MNKIAFFALMLALGLVGGCGNKKEEKKEEKDLARISQKQDQIEVKAAKARLAPFEMELVSNGKLMPVGKRFWLLSRMMWSGKYM